MESFKFSFVFLVFFLRVLFVIVTPQRLFALDTIGVFIYIYIYILFIFFHVNMLDLFGIRLFC